MKLNITERLLRARDLNAGLSAERETERIGTFRGGSSGMLSADGRVVVGKCLRQSLLRSMGLVVEEPLEESKQIIFDRGRDQEYSILADLNSSLSAGEILLREEEIPTEWYTSNGRKVTGRPDGVICSEVKHNHTITRTPVCGLEIKSIGSFWVTKSVLLERSPKVEHLIQAAHYMWQLKLGQYKLIYRQNSSLIIPNYPFIFKLLPKNSEDTGHWLHGLIKFDRIGKPLEVKPYTLVYDLNLTNSGQLQIKLESDSTWTDTIVRISDIERYFEYLSTMESEKKLGVEPVAVNHSGEKQNFRVQDYCNLRELCCGKCKLDYDSWLTQVKKRVIQLGEKSK